MRKNKKIPLPISKFINTKFRDYAVYVLESRGIPSFYDALTPVQRYILHSSPASFTKTLSVVGKSIEDGYHHGNISIEKAISKLARPFGSGLQILEGYGFFGTEVSPEPAAARYTSVRLSSRAADIIKKYSYLSSRNEDGSHNPFWLDIPIGLTSTIVGIAVGYKTTILPRKLEDIREFLAGKRKSLKPYFIDFNGSIKKYKGLDNSWLISSEIVINDNRIEIRGLPPVMKYSSALKKLDALFSKYDGRIKVINNSNTSVKIDLIYTGKSASEWEEIKAFAEKAFSVIVTESPIFIKDGHVLVYEKVEEYIEDYKWQVLRLLVHDLEYKERFSSEELEFNIAKLEFISFILSKKRTIEEIDKFLKEYSKNISQRLEGLTSKKFSKDELDKTKIRIVELRKELSDIKKRLKEARLDLSKSPDPTSKRGIASSKNTVDLFDSDDIREIDGITIWDGDDPFDKTAIPGENLE